MRRLSKKLLAVLLAAVMAIPTLLVMPFAAEAVSTIEWTPVASSDFTQATPVTNGSLGEVPTYEGQGKAMTWSTNCYTEHGNVSSSSSDNALYVPDGFIYLSGYEDGAVPIKNSSNWRIELGFRFKDVQESGIHVTDGYHSDEEHCFIKMYNNTAALSAPTNALHDACYFEQNANGQCYAGEYTVGEGATNPDNAVCTGSENLSAGVDYTYVAEYSNGVFKAYIQSGKEYVQFINETDDEDFINALADTTGVNSIKIGDDNNSAYYRSLEYKYIVFSTGTDTGTLEDKMLEAFELYETKMGGDIFTGMTDAYDAYVEANKIYDAWKYGNNVVTDEQLEAAAKNLRKKSIAMKQWSYNGISGTTPWYAADSGDTSAYANYGVANILHWEDPVNVASNSNQAVKIDIWAPSRTVLLLDSDDVKPAMPIMAFAQLTDSKTRYVYNLYPCVSSSDNSNNTYFRLGTVNDETAWYGHNGNSDRPHNWIDDMTSATDGRPKGESGTDSTKRLSLSSSNGCGGGTRYWASFSNVLKFVGNQTTAVESYSLNWSRLTGDQASDSNIFSTSNTIQVVNYKMLLDKMNDATNLNTINVAEKTYTQGGLRSLLVAYDKATAFNIYDYDYSNTSSVASAGTAITEAAAAFNDVNVTEDVDGYEDLRKAIEPKMVVYNGGAEGYTEESWTPFAAAFEAAQAVFTNIQTTGYNDGANAKALADALNAVEPVPSVDKVDTTNLEISINEAVEAIHNRTMFTTDSYSASNIAAVVENAKIAVWGAAANYPNAKDKLDLDDTNTAIVEAQRDEVNRAIYALRIDKDAAVAAAGSQSINSAIALAANYNSGDYGNYQDLSSAVQAARNFVPTVNTITDGCITEKIAEYKSKVRAIINAINLLRPAFDKITNGTIASITEGVQTVVNSTERDKNPRWRLYFTRNNNAVIFRTQYEAFTVDLGGARLEFYDDENDHAAELDSINVYDETDNTVGVITTNTSTLFGNPSPVSIDNAQNTYPGMTTASTDENSSYTIKNITAYSYDGDRIGYGVSGESITDTSTILDDVLATTQGSSSDALTGTITAKGGSTYMTADYIISIPLEPKKTLSEKTVPTLTEHTISSNLGMVYYWRYHDATKHIGYSHNRTPYTQTTYVINIAPLVALIAKAREEDENELNYQKSAWEAFSTALKAARADMDYSNMTATEIEEACQTRYTNLWNAYTTLKNSPAATNASIHSAVESDEEVGNAYKADNKDGRWSAARWAAFKDAYETAAGAIATNGIYSDANVRDYSTSEQPAIDAIATALTTAYNNLVTYGPRADFTALENAATRSGYEVLEDDKYTASSLEAIATALADADAFPYLNMTEAQRNAVYSETENVTAIANEVTAVEDLYATALVEATVDAAALDAAKTEAKAKIKDPDAYSNIAEIKALIDDADYSQDVTIYGSYKVSGVKYETQAELNAAVEALLAGLTAKAYTVTVVDENNAAVDVTFKDENGNTLASTDGTITLDYGTKVVVYAPDEEKFDWFYSYKSNTSEQASKYYTTDMWVHLTVRGDTTLKVKSAAQETETVKVTYVNALTGKIFAVDYTAKNEAYALQDAPILAYYNFLGYSLETESEDYVTSISPAEDTIVFANYEFDEDVEYFTVTLGNLGGSITTTQYLPEDLEYNDLVEFTVGNGTYGGANSGLYQSGKKNGQYKINGETYELPGTNKNPIKYASPEIYAWVIVKEDDGETWEEKRDTSEQSAALPNVEKVVMYGDTYSFRVCENVYVIPYSEDEFNEAVEAGLVEGVSAQEKAAVYANDKLLEVKNDSGEIQKVSMIGNFTLPEGDFTLVETGMLFKATTDGTVPEADLTLGNAGANGIARMKSSSHTAGNQFVISVKTTKFVGTNTTIGVKYRAYLIYTDGTEQFVVYSDVVTGSSVIE